MAAATGLSTRALGVFRIALASTGIGLIVLAVGALAAAMMDLRGTALAAIDPGDAALDSAQVAALERARVSADTLAALLQNKVSIAADATKLQKDRKLLMAKADGIAERALRVEQQMERLRG